jgi:tryptophan halogenase
MTPRQHTETKTDELRILHASIAQVKATREEVMLLLGRRHEKQPDPGQLRVALETLIRMSPSAARRLSILLSRALQQYEARHGSLERQIATHERLVPTPAISPPDFSLEKAAKTAGRCLQFLDRLNVQPAFERSFKVKDNILLTKRFLFGFEKDLIGPRPNERVIELCEQIGMPPKLMAPFMADLPEAGIVGFGFGENETTCIAKAYLEFGIRYYRAMKEKPDRPDPYLSHIGYKWDLSDTKKTVVTEYTCYPAYTVGDMLETLSSGIYKDRARSPYGVVKRILDAAAGKAVEEKFLFLGVGEDNTSRNSFDINIYGADMKIKEITGDLLGLFRFYAVAEDESKALLESIQDQAVGHIAGGVGRDGQSFVTLYYGK